MASSDQAGEGPSSRAGDAHTAHAVSHAHARGHSADESMGRHAPSVEEISCAHAPPAIAPAMARSGEIEPRRRKSVESAIDIRLQLLESQNLTLHAQHEMTQQMIAKLTEMVGGLQLQLQQQRQASATKLSSSPPKPAPGPIATTEQRNSQQSLVDTINKISPAAPPAVQTQPVTPPQRPRSGSATQAALAAAAVALAKVSRAARRPSLSSATVVPMMTRRFMVSSLHFSAVKETKWRRLARWTRNLFTRARDGNSGARQDFQAPHMDEVPLHPLTIHHDSHARFLWDTLMMVMILIDIIVTPLSLSFRYEPHGILMFNTAATVLFSMDFVIQALSSFTTPKGTVVSGLFNTIPNYLFSGLAVADFLSWFPFHVILPYAESKLLGIAKVVRLVKLRQLARRFNSSKKAGMFRLIRLFGIVFLVSHGLACYWNWVAKEWRQHEAGYLEKSLASKYSHCWSLVIGSLNASPPAMYTPIEETSVAFFMLIGNVLQATVFGSVAVLISSFDEEEATYNKKVFEVYERCKLLDIPEDLAVRIRNYYERLFLETRSVNPDADSFINELSPALICEVKFQLYRDMIKQIPFFSAASIDPVVIEMLILRLRTVIYMQDDVLIRKGEFGDWMGFVGSKGSVGVLDPNTNSNLIVRVLQKGEYFGEMGLLHRAKRSMTLVALSWVQIHVLSRRDLDDVKEQYAEEAEGLEEEIERFMTTRVKASAPRNDDAGPSKKLLKWLM